MAPCERSEPRLSERTTLPAPEGRAGREAHASKIINVYITYIYSGPKLPEPIYSHCLAKIDENHAFLTGGKTIWGTRNQTHLYTQDTQSWIRGPEMIQSRSEHVCGSFYSLFHSTTMVVVAGGQNGFGQKLDTVELLILTQNQWFAGPKLPKPLYGSTMVSLRNSFLIIGGVSGINDYQSSIHSLNCKNECEWKTLKQELKVARMQSVAMMVPNNMTHCNVKKS